MGLGSAKAALYTYAAPEVRDAYARTLELCRQAGRTPQLFHALRGLYAHLLVTGQSLRSVEVCEQLLDLAERADSPALRVVGHQSMGFALMSAGRQAEAHRHLETMLALHGSAGAVIDLSVPGIGAPLLVGMAVQCWVLWFLGWPEKAVRCSRRTEEMARDLNVPFPRCNAEQFAADLHAFRGEIEDVERLAASLTQVAGEQGLKLYVQVCPRCGTDLYLPDPAAVRHPGVR